MNTLSNTLFSALLLAVAASGCAFDQGTGGADAALSGRPYFEVFEASNGDHYFNLKAANHQVILSSEGYSSRQAALNGVLSVMDHGENEVNFDLWEASNGEFYFTLQARNGAVIGTSETYSTLSNARRGVRTVNRNVTEYLDFLANRTGARFDVFRGADERYYFNLHAANGEIVLSSQGYTTEEAALSATFSVAENGVNEARYDVNEAADGSFYFNLKARNGRVIGTSETYVSRSNAERGCRSIVALLPDVELL